MTSLLHCGPHLYWMSTRYLNLCPQHQLAAWATKGSLALGVGAVLPSRSVAETAGAQAVIGYVQFNFETHSLWEGGEH